GVEAVVVEMGQGELDFVKVEPEVLVLHPDLENTVSGMFVLAKVISKRVRRLGLRDALGARLGPGFYPRLLPLHPDLQHALAPWSLVQTKPAFVHVITDNVIETSAVISDHEDNHSNALARQERDLGMETRQVSAVVCKKVSPVRSRIASHPVGRV